MTWHQMVTRSLIEESFVKVSKLDKKNNPDKSECKLIIFCLTEAQLDKTTCPIPRPPPKKNMAFILIVC